MKNANKALHKVFLLMLMIAVAQSLTACGNTPEAPIYTAGTYTATAKGMSDITVTVSVDANKITSVELDVSGETKDIGQAAADKLIKQVMDAQSSEIDGVSGATVTSDAVSKGVADCLAQAKGEDVKTTYDGAIDKMYDTMAKRAEEHAPEVRTLTNGVQIQRTPTEYNCGVYHSPGASISFNTYYLKADSRGCAACHEDLAQTLKDMDYEHVDLTSNYGIAVTVNNCLDCHSYSPWYVTETYGFGSLIHSIHDADSFTGSCWSCHYASGDGKDMQLWDSVKYTVLRGIVSVDNPENVSAEFSYNQDLLTSTDNIFDYGWLYYDNDYYRYGMTQIDAPLDEDTFNNWTLTVSGTVDNPFTISLPDLIKEAPAVTKTITMNCTDNYSGGPLIANCEVTGVSLKWLLEKAQIKPSSTVILPTSSDGFAQPIYLSFLENRDAYVVWEINGERVSYANGYPLQLWLEGGSASVFIKEISDIIVTDEPEENYYMYLGWETEDGGYYNKPGVGMFNSVNEGEIVSLGQSYTFSGYADAFEQKITAIEVSLDNGTTWTSYPVTGTTESKWVIWNYTITPTEVGAYVIQVRGVTEDGLVSRSPAQMMINVALS